MPRRHAMDGWVEIGGDVNWEAYGGKWARQIPGTNQFLIIEHMNMEDGGWKPGDSEDHYTCDLSWLDLDGIPPHEIQKAAHSVGAEYVSMQHNDLSYEALSYEDGTVVDSDSTPHFSYVLAEVCYDYGLRGPLYSFGGSYPMRLRAAARRAAESFIEDNDSLQRRLTRPVNAIGSSAREMACGDIFSAMIEKRNDRAVFAATLYAKADCLLDGSPIPDAVKIAGTISDQ